ncbi:hypothetical protein D9757_008786 [Collybiopsis confluens]|uniref:Uncharacterized protein n=1 Tax=Collybiopsis confluens TaxID=2823264 RepID=A0A8H5M1F5_9AGAR|nr:hypothetical protein D9757_008786 [Collybiopsis confluens]
MTLVECGIKVWIVRATKDRPILSSKETKRTYGDTVCVEAEVDCTVKGLTYFIYWQQTEDYPARRATCKVYTLSPTLAETQRGQPVTMIPGQQAVVHSTRQAEVHGKFFKLSSSIFSEERLKQSNGIAGYGQLRVDFENEAAKPASVLFTFVFKDARKKLNEPLLSKKPSSSPQAKHTRVGLNPRSQQSLEGVPEQNGCNASAGPAQQAENDLPRATRSQQKRARSLGAPLDDDLQQSLEEAQRGLKESDVSGPVQIMLKRARLGQYHALLAMQMHNEEETERVDQETKRIWDRFEKTF